MWKIAVPLVLLLTVAALAVDMDKLLMGEIQVSPEDMAAPVISRGYADSIAWIQMPNAPIAISRFGKGRIGNYIYIFGAAASSMAYNLTTEQWEATVPPTITGNNWTGCAANGEFYLFPKSSGYSDVQKFTPSGGGPSGSWTLEGFYPQTNFAFAVAWDGGNYIYCAGGSIPCSNLAYRYNLTTHSFETLPTMPEARSYVGGAFANGEFYVVGGFDAGYNYQGSCYEYDPSLNAWNTRSPMPVALGFTAWAVDTDGARIWVIGAGGNYYTWPGTNTVQVYDIATNSWYQETPRLTTFGVNVGMCLPNLNYILDMGGYTGTANSNMVVKGVLHGYARRDLEVTLTPLNPPILIPAGGGSFQFNAQIENTSSGALIFDAWTMVRLPNGVYYGPLIRRTNLPIAAGQTISRSRIAQFVPGYAPAGSYTYIGRVGIFPDSVISEDDFTFTKLAGEVSPAHNQGWACSGWFEEEAVSVQPSAFGINSNPNPFNPVTTLSFTLAEAGLVSLKVYDVQGRVIAHVAEGFYPAGKHQFEWDAASFASGVYFAKLQAEGNSAVAKMLLVK